MSQEILIEAEELPEVEHKRLNKKRKERVWLVEDSEAEEDLEIDEEDEDGPEEQSTDSRLAQSTDSTVAVLVPPPEVTPFDITDITTILDEHWTTPRNILQNRAQTAKQNFDEFFKFMGNACGVDLTSSNQTNKVYVKVPPDHCNETKYPRLIEKSLNAFVEAHKDETATIAFEDPDCPLELITLSHVKQAIPHRGKDANAAGIDHLIQQKTPVRKPTGKKAKTIPIEPKRAADNRILVTVSMVLLWKHDSRKRKFNCVTFNPFPKGHPHAPKVNDLNFFRPFAITKKAAKERRKVLEASDKHGTGQIYKRAVEGCKMMFTHIAEMWAQEEPDTGWYNKVIRGDLDSVNPILAYILRWMAHLFQTPWELPGTSLYVYGPEGAGKGIVVQWLGEALGYYMFTQTGAIEDLAGDFTDVLRNTLLIFADEANNASNAKFDAKLKTLITEMRLRVRAMYCPPSFIFNCLRLIFASNKIEGIPNEVRKRRYMLIGVEKVRDQAYYSSLANAVARDDKAALYLFMDILYHIPIGDWMGTRTPVATPLSEQVMLRSLGAVARFMLDCLDKGCHNTGTLNDTNMDKVVKKRESYEPWERAYADALSKYTEEEDPPHEIYALYESVNEITDWVSFISVELLYSTFQSWARDRKVSPIPITEDFIREIQAFLPHVTTEPIQVQSAVFDYNEQKAVTVYHPKQYIELGLIDLCRVAFATTLGLRTSRTNWWNSGDIREHLRYPFSESFVHFAPSSYSQQ